MIRRNQKLINRFNGMSDSMLLMLFCQLSSWLWQDVIRNTDINIVSIINTLGNKLFIGAIYPQWALKILPFFCIYSTTRIHQSEHSAENIMMANAVTLATGAAASYVFCEEGV